MKLSNPGFNPQLPVPTQFGARFKVSDKVTDAAEGVGSAAGGAATVYSIGMPAGTLGTASLVGGGLLGIWGSKQVYSAIRGKKAEGASEPETPAADDKKVEKQEANPLDDLEKMVKDGE